MPRSGYFDLVRSMVTPGWPSLYFVQMISRGRALAHTVAVALVAALTLTMLTQPSVAKPERRAATTATEPTRLGVAFGNTLVHMSDAALATALDDARALGVRWIRADLAWTDVQPDGPSTFRWGPFDRVVTAARSRGLRVLPILTYTPAWARDAGCARFSCPPRSATEFATFARRAVARYGVQGVTTWEIWNEPNLTIFWPEPDAQRYATLLDATTRAIKKQQPGATVLLGGLAAIEPSWSPGSLEPRDFLRSVCATGACARIDGVAYHPYTYPYPAGYAAPWFDTAWEKISSTSWSLRSILDAAGRSSVGIWATEYGAPTGGEGTAADGTWESLTPTTDHVTEGWQAYLATDVVRTASADEDVRALFWYASQDQPSARGREAYFGLRRADGTRKSAWSAFQQAVAEASGDVVR